jgi:xylitol oxidase
LADRLTGAAMDKREFLKTSGALITGGLLSNFVGEADPATPRTNWAGNYTFHARDVYAPKSVEEVQAIVRKHDKLKALGARHSFNNIADTSGGQVSLENLKDMEVDAKSRTVTVGAGVRYGQLAPYLDQHGFALHNLASLPHVSVVGACATATHGSGIKNGNLSTAVSGLESVNGKGEVVKLTRQDSRFAGAVVGLGALGVATKITLDLQPTFQMRQVVYENLSFDKLEHHLDEIFGAGYSVSLFTDWQNHRATQVWIKSRVTPGSAWSLAPEFFGAKAATRNLHPLAGHSAENCTEQMGVPGPWYERMPHFRMNFTPSSGQELQSEFFVQRSRAYEAILAVEKLRDQITPHLFITELRTIESDGLWISTAYQRQSLAIHFTWKPEWDAVKTVLPKIEEQLRPFDARPHWAKLFTMPASRLKLLYTRMPEFQQLAMQFDPNGKFRNEFLNEHVFA